MPSIAKKPSRPAAESAIPTAPTAPTARAAPATSATKRKSSAVAASSAAASTTTAASTTARIPAARPAPASDQEQKQKQKQEQEQEQDPEQDGLLAAALILTAASAEVRRASAALTAALTSPRLAAGATVHPRRTLRAVGLLLRALNDPDGLGFAACGGVLGESVRVTGVLTRRKPLAVTMAAQALGLRVKAAAEGFPQLNGAAVQRLIGAVSAARPLAAATAAREMVAESGITRFASTLTPVIMELVAWTALMDVNPFNDDAAWVVLGGGNMRSEPFLGIPMAMLGNLDLGPGRAQLAFPDHILARQLERSENDVASYADDIAALGNHGLVLLRTVLGADDTIRHVLMLPGTSFGKLANKTPQDVVGVFDGLMRTNTTYTRAARKVLEAAQVPEGSELMIVGHSLGGITAINLAADPDFCAAYRLTHVVTLGSPIDNKRTADPHTKVISLVNEYDFFPGIDGRGPACPVPLPPDWTELVWRDETFDFPLSHAPQTYAATLRTAVPEHRARTNQLIARYDGQIVANTPYTVRDR